MRSRCADSRQRLRQHVQQDRGSVSVEFALALPAVTLVLLLIVSIFGYGLVQQRTVDAARYAGRELSLGTDSATVTQRLHESFGRGFTLEVWAEPPLLGVRVHTQFGWQGLGLDVSETLWVYDETGL